MKLRASIVVASLLVGGVTLTSASPASAATPPCTGQGDRIGVVSTPIGDVRLVIFFPAHSHDQVVYVESGGDWINVGHGYWSCALRQGSTGPGVWRLQATLNYCYGHIIGPRLNPDGQFGKLTKAALVKVQQHHGIASDGQYGPQTARTINHFVWMETGDGCGSLAWGGWPGNSG